jgi:hypothetical protein
MDRSAEDALKEPFKRTNRTQEREQRRAKSRVRVCEAPGCKEEGQYPAPKSRRRVKERYHFCLEHVREYNKAWNYFEGMTPGAVERDRLAAMTWDRPTWRFGEQGRAKAGQRASAFSGNAFKDGFGFFEEDERDEEEIRARDTRRLLRSLPPEYRQAFDTLEIQPPVTPEALKSHYKDLVRKLHPDLNQNDPAAEEKMKAVNAAYSLVRDIIENAE